MKKIVFVAVMCVAVVACAFANGAADVDLARLVAEDVSKPVRPGGVDGQPFWNGHADWFLYPPSFDFKVVPGATRYRFTVLDDQHLARTFETNVPTASLAPVWGKIPPGFVSVTCEGVDADGKVCGLVGRRLRFWRQAPFRAGGYPPAKRPYAEAADGAGGYALLFRELNENDGYTLDLSPIFGKKPLKVECVIGGRGEAVLDGTALRVKIPEKLDFIWVKLGV